MIYVNFIKKVVFFIFFYLAIGNVHAARPDSLMSNYKLYPLPLISYNSDVGLNYGGLFYMYYYGKHRRFFPNYKTRLYLEVSSSVKGSQVARIQVDYKEVLKNFRGIFDAGIFRDAALPFFGFEDVISMRRKSLPLSYYRAFRGMIYARTGGFLNVLGDKIKVFGDLDLYQIRMDNTKKTDEELILGHDTVKQDNTLFNDLRRWGVLDSMCFPGFKVALTSGIIYNSRKPVDFSPYKGIYAEILGRWMPSVLSINGSGKGYFRVFATFKHFVSVLPERIIFAYRILASKRLWGKVPFTEKPFYFTAHDWYDAVGGINTLRGVFRDRLVADDYVITNIEMRIFVTRFNLFSSMVELVVYPYLDAGRVFIDNGYGRRERIPLQRREDFETGYGNIWALTYGGGAGFVIDYNFVTNISFGVPNNEDLGDKGIFLGLNFMF